MTERPPGIYEHFTEGYAERVGMPDIPEPTDAQIEKWRQRFKGTRFDPALRAGGHPGELFFDEDSVSRDEGGRFATEGSEGNPIKVDSALEAAGLIADGKYVEMPPEQVSILLDELAAIAQDARDHGEKAPTYDLCQISVPDTNLFCAESQDVPRLEMPQLSGEAVPGSDAAALVESDNPVNKGEVDGVPAFKEALAAGGIAFHDESVPASELKPTQNELDGAKVAGIMQAMEAGTMPPGRIFVSSDNYVVDGHHRWAASVGIDIGDNHLGDVNQDVVRVDAPISVLLDFANQFADDFGIKQKGVG